MRRSAQALFLVLAAILASACDRGVPWDSEEATTTEPRPDFGPTAAYGRRLVFLGPGTPLPTAAVFDFTSLSDSVGVQRGVRGRLLVGEEWLPLMDAGWSFGPMREPWRIVPGGDLKVVVSDGGEIAAILSRGEPAVRLEPASLIAETSPDAGTRFVLRQASLAFEEQTLRGILLDSQLGRSVSAASVLSPPPADSMTESADNQDAPSEDGGEDGEAGEAGEAEAADSQVAPSGAGPAPTGRPTPIARPGAEAFLVNNSGYYVVFANSAGGDLAWVSHDDGDEIQRGAVLEPTTWEATGENGTELPTQWRIAGSGSLSGELSAAAADASALTGLRDVTSLGYILVTGWVGDNGVRRDVFGLVRQVR